MMRNQYIFVIMAAAILWQDNYLL